MSPVAPMRPALVRASLCSFFSLGILIGVFLLRSTSTLQTSAHAEMLGHMGASAGITLSLSGVWMALRSDRKIRLIAVLCAGAAATLALELAQGPIPNRVIELGDILAGFAGVLIAGIAIGTLCERSTQAVSVKTTATAAALGAVILTGVLILEPEGTSQISARPDGKRCPLTEIVGAGERILIGNNRATNGCLDSALGGFTVFEANPQSTTGDVLVSSDLQELTRRIKDEARVIIRTQINPTNFGNASSALATLRAGEAGDLLALHARLGRTEIYGPTLTPMARTASFSNMRTSDESALLEVRLDRGTMTTLVNGVIVATTSVDPEWSNALRAEETPLTLFLNNNPSGRLPANGVLEWIEIEVES